MFFFIFRSFSFKMLRAVNFYTLFLLLTLVLLPGTLSLANCPAGCDCDDDTLVVQCDESRLDVLPIALNPSIQRLVIRNNKIKTVDSSIQFYAELHFLDLSSNHLLNIPPKTFDHQHKLQELHLNHNKISMVHNKTFQGLNSLTVSLIFFKLSPILIINQFSINLFCNV